MKSTLNKNTQTDENLRDEEKHTILTVIKREVDGAPAGLSQLRGCL